MSFGGFLGIDESYHPLPWKVLTYDTDQGGYVVDLDKAMLEKALSYRSGTEPRFDRAYGEQVYGYNVRSEDHTSEILALIRISNAGLCLKKEKIKDGTSAATDKSL